jgi:hypothetical protein
MPYIVEVALATEDLADELNKMRVWLDHMKFRQSVSGRFRVVIPGESILKVNNRR